MVLLRFDLVTEFLVHSIGRLRPSANILIDISSENSETTELIETKFHIRRQGLYE